MGAGSSRKQCIIYLDCIQKMLELAFNRNVLSEGRVKWWRYSKYSRYLMITYISWCILQAYTTHLLLHTGDMLAFYCMKYTDYGYLPLATSLKTILSIPKHVPLLMQGRKPTNSSPCSRFGEVYSRMSQYTVTSPVLLQKHFFFLFYFLSVFFFFFPRHLGPFWYHCRHPLRGSNLDTLQSHLSSQQGVSVRRLNRFPIKYSF